MAGAVTDVKGQKEHIYDQGKWSIQNRQCRMDPALWVNALTMETHGVVCLHSRERLLVDYAGANGCATGSHQQGDRTDHHPNKADSCLSSSHLSSRT